MKSTEESFARCEGLFNITVTPFDAAGQFNFVALSENIERVLSTGYDGLLIGGTYGEFPAMDTAERAQLFRTVMDIVGDRVPVLLCTASAQTRVVHELTVLASELGGLPMVTAPYVSEITDDQIIEFFSEVAPLSRNGIMVYNAPGIGITLSPALIERLCNVSGVVALKQGDLNPTSVDVLVGRLGGRIRLLAASDLAMLGPLALGFDGVSSTNSCALPELIHDTYTAMRSGNAQLAGKLQRIWYPLRECARRYGQPQTVKSVMNLRGLQGGHVRTPLRDVTPPQREQIYSALNAVAADPLARIRMPS